ncbi:FK506-binding protein 3-like [Solanum stenotomum]|uniref:FK506-binding protein 3-like n=1 Tax=Solanum stenotomum TaxID=172797 RepID=UPI0020D1AA6D|nr:FK506-binding protein 3-like [Solanum stenotomum]
MDYIEEVFMKWNYIDKKPYDICHMIEEAVLVAGIKYPHQFDKRKNRIIRMISNPSSFDDEDDDEDDDTSTLEEDNDTTTLEEEDSVVGDEDEVTNAEEETRQSQKQITKPLKIRITYSKTAQVAPLENHNNCNAITLELKKTPETHDLDGLKEETQRQSHNTTMGSTKRMSTKHVQVAPPRIKLLSDFSFEKYLDGHKQLNKQSQKGFKKMETDRIQHKN